MKKVLIRAPLLSMSGYGEHSRQVFRWLRTKKNIELYTEILPWGITPWKLNTDDPVVKDILSLKSKPQDQDLDISFQVQLPNEWDANAADFNVGITAAVETDMANPGWTYTEVKKMDRVVVPSAHAKNTLVGESKEASEKTHVVPESFFSELRQDPKEIDLNLSSSFNFLTVGMLTGLSVPTDRKNLFYLIRWFVEAFNGEEDVGLIIKTSRGRDTDLDRAATKKILNQVLKEIGHTGSPKVYLLHGGLDREEMNSLYKHPKVKAFVSLTRGEGFGLPHLEAAAADLPVIATNWSAHKEFLDLGNWIKVDYNLEKIDASRVDDQIFMNGARWANANEFSFKQSLQKYRKKPDLPNEWAKDLGKKIREKYSPEAINKAYDDALGDVIS